ncbi:Pectate lyase superfamily protein [Caballeronia temeraria]|uniref:Pectate lyase superfamily protein n=1 Tax=Caballeronia temeraria TaxID=1777137 RepID=A0A157ZVF6_9BURK|nr:right-handed parallel beta-helix repeat-containing protein [Caballeronia temeraria]SAK49524.1 Pectate lyase superfamily protein [Caballeronia temeraria]
MDRRKRETLFTLAKSGAAAVMAAVPASQRAGAQVSTADGWVDPTQLGAIADGASHPLSTRYTTLDQARSVYPFVTALDQEIDGCAIQAALNASTKVRLPVGRFRISDALTVRSNTELQGAGAGTILTWTRQNSAERFAMFAAQYSSAIRLQGFSVVDASGSMGGYVFAGTRVVNVNLEQISADRMAIAMFFASDGQTYESVSGDLSNAAFNVSSDVHVTGCTATNIANSADPRAAVLFQYCVGWSVTDCKFSNAPYGVQWWGGDSSPNADGALVNARKCADGTVTNVQVSNCVAGVWGSMGTNVKIVGCHVDTASDVGIDFEGCTNSSASQNSVRNCTNGNFACFWWNDNVSFVGNTSHQNRADYPHVRVYNDSQGTSNRSMTINGNTFVTDQAIGVIDTAYGGVQTLEFLNNQLTDTRVEFSDNTLRYVTVTDNQLTFTRAATDTMNALEIGSIYDNGLGLAARNVIESKVTQPPDSAALYLWSDDPNSDSQFQAVENRTAGFPVDLVTDNWSANPERTSYFTIQGNTFGSGVYKKEDHGAKISVTVLQSNQGISN